MEDTSKSPNWLRYFSGMLLVLTTLLWGTSFIIAKNLISSIPVFFYLLTRFLIASIVFFPIFLSRVKKVNRSIVIAGILNGLVYFLAIATQTIGMYTTTAGKAGFITGLNTLIVPFMAWVGFKRRIKKRIWIAVFISVFGMAFLVLEGPAGIVIGDIFEIFCAFFCALYIIIVDYHVNIKQMDVYVYCFFQIVMISLTSFLSFLLFNESLEILNFDFNYWIVIIYLGAIVTALTFIFQNYGQKHIDPSKTAVIFALEPVFAVLFASLLIGNEEITIRGLIGFGLIFLAIIIAVIKDKEIEQTTDRILEKKVALEI